MKIEILTEFKHGTETYFPGEVIVFPDGDNTGEYFCRAGWGKDVDGVIPTATPSLNDVVLEVQPIDQIQANSTLGV